MLPEVGGTELIVVALVALIVVGPKDLPVLLRKVGQWVGKMRSLASEFRTSFDELARQSELDELRKEVEALRNARGADPLDGAYPTIEELHGFPAIGDGSASSDSPSEPEPEPAPARKPRARKPKAEAAPAAVAAKAKPRAKRSRQAEA